MKEICFLFLATASIPSLCANADLINAEAVYDSCSSRSFKNGSVRLSGEYVTIPDTNAIESGVGSFELDNDGDGMIINTGIDSTSGSDNLLFITGTDVTSWESEGENGPPISGVTFFSVNDTGPNW